MATAGDRYWDLVKEQLTEERSRKTSLEQRGITVITSAAAMVTLLFGLTALATKASATYVLPDPAPGLLIAAGALFLMAAVLAIAINWAVHYIEVTPAGLRGVITEDWAGDEAAAGKTVADAWIDIVEGARDRNRFKGQVLRLALIVEVAALGAVAAAVVVILVTG